MADVSGDRPWYEELAPDLEGDAGRGVEGSRVDSRRRVMAVWRGFEDSRAGVWLAEHTRLLAGLSSEGSVLVRRLAVGVLLAAMAFTLLLFAAAGGDPVAGGLLAMPFWMAALAVCAVLWVFWDAYRDSGERLVDRLSSAPGMATRRQVAAACGVREVMRTMVPSVLPAMLAAAMRERRMGGDPVWPRPWQAAMYVGECHHVGVWLSLEMHAYVLGPTRSGKTVTVVIPVVDKDPFGDASGKPSTGGEAGDGDGPRQVTVGDRTLCEDTPVESNTDDWNGRRSLLGETGSAILPLGVGALLMAGLGAAVVMVRRRKSAHDDKDAALMPRHAA